ncbi:MAG TPA: hypothetical protein VK923_18895 [Euzebyales bacterium]|nr:hypothetical protein [Euzebyales bacterium]
MTYGTDRQGLELKAFSYDIWDPAKGLAPSSHTTLPVPTSTNLFCSAQTILPWSGQVLITGGDEYGFPGGSQFDAVSDVNLFDPDSQTVTRLADSTARAGGTRPSRRCRTARSWCTEAGRIAHPSHRCSCRNLKQRSAQIRVQEETSYDRETGHTRGKVGFVVIGAK